MADWPNNQSLRNCIDWNIDEHRRAMKDSRNKDIHVPATAVKYNGSDRVQMSAVEYREMRKLDAQRYERNIRNLRERLGDPFYGELKG